jgi:hypothetical protein
MESNWRVQVCHHNESTWRNATPANMTEDEATEYARRSNNDYSVHVTYRAVQG